MIENSILDKCEECGKRTNMLAIKDGKKLCYNCFNKDIPDKTSEKTEILKELNKKISFLFESIGHLSTTIEYNFKELIKRIKKIEEKLK